MGPSLYVTRDMDKHPNETFQNETQRAMRTLESSGNATNNVMDATALPPPVVFGAKL